MYSENPSPQIPNPKSSEVIPPAALSLSRIAPAASSLSNGARPNHDVGDVGMTGGADREADGGEVVGLTDGDG